jgi:hypothetical protein
MTLALILVIAGAWLLHVSRPSPRPRPPSRPRLIVEIEVKRPAAATQELDSRTGL